MNVNSKCHSIEHNYHNDNVMLKCGTPIFVKAVVVSNSF